MRFFLFLIVALTFQFAMSVDDSAERRRNNWSSGGQWGHGGGQWGQGENERGRGQNQWVQGGNPWAQGGNRWNRGGNQGGQGDSNSKARLAICRFLDRCPNVGEVNTYASAYNGKTNELIRVLADSGDFETNFISNKQDACQNLYRKILDRNVDSDGQFLCSKVIPALGYRWVKNQLIDSQEYQRKFGSNTVPGFGQCPRDCAN